MEKMGSALEQVAMGQGAVDLEDSPRNPRRTPVRIRRVFSLGFERHPGRREGRELSRIVTAPGGRRDENMAQISCHL